MSDEIDTVPRVQGRLEHRFRLWPGFTFAIEFSDAIIARESLSSQHD